MPILARPKEPWYFSQQVSERRRQFLSLERSPSSSLVCCGCERTRPEYRIDRRSLPFSVVEFVAQGEGRLVLAGREYALQPGAAFAYAPRMHHVIRSHPDRPMLKYFIGFVGRDPAKILKATRLGRWQPVRIGKIAEVTEMFELVLREAAQGGQESRRVCNALLPALLFKIEQAAHPGVRASAAGAVAYERARRYIEDHHLGLRSVEEVAEACHMTPAYLSRLFRQFGRMGAHQFLVRLKMNHAAERLFDGGLTVKEVAAELGFSDPFHFSRVFKRVYGVPPVTIAKDARYDPAFGVGPANGSTPGSGRTR